MNIFIQYLENKIYGVIFDKLKHLENMSEFKGTKGKWIIEKAESDSNGRGVYRVVTWNIPNNSDLQYNAQLISKAPEMLELLKDMYDDYECFSDISSNGFGKRLEQLIKEATTI